MMASWLQVVIGVVAHIMAIVLLLGAVWMGFVVPLGEVMSKMTLAD